MKAHPELVQDDWEYMLTGSDFYTQLIKYNGFLLHSSCIVVDNVAYAFSADSGTASQPIPSFGLSISAIGHICSTMINRLSGLSTARFMPAELLGAVSMTIQHLKWLNLPEFAFFKEAKTIG